MRGKLLELPQACGVLVNRISHLARVGDLTVTAKCAILHYAEETEEAAREWTRKAGREKGGCEGKTAHDAGRGRSGKRE